jgi:polyhydroxyalkanoate synthesis regulator phasin
MPIAARWKEMAMRTKIIAAFVAGGLLVGAGFLTSVISAPGAAQAQDTTEDDSTQDDSTQKDTAPDDSQEPERRFLRPALGFLEDVLDDLIADGTLTDEQADAVIDGVEAKAQDLIDEHGGELRERLREGREHWGPFKNGLRFGALLDDGGIDQDEYDALGEDHPLKQVDVTEYLADGTITPEELRELMADLWEARQDD